MATEKRLIDAKVFADHLERMTRTAYPNLFPGLLEAIDYAKDFPTVDAVEVVHGRWREKILVGGFAEEWGYVCSECGCTVSDRSNLSFGRFASINQRLNYCPNCGAKMDG